MFKYIKIILLAIAVSFIISSFTKEDKEEGKDRDILSVPSLFGQMQKIEDIKYNSIIKLVNAKYKGYCSAFVIDSNYAITAAHCVNNNGYIDKSNIHIFNDTGFNTHIIAHVIGYDQRTDLGLIIGDFHEFHSLKVNFNNEGFPMHEKHMYYTCGFPLGQKHLVCHIFEPLRINNFQMEGTGHLIPGMSGGPVINELSEAVGVNSAVEDDMSIVSPLEGILGLFNLE